jgi:hypothetical protein
LISNPIPIYKIIIPKEEPNPCKDIIINNKATVDVPFHNKHIRFENLTSEQAGYLLQVSEFYQLSGTRRSAVVPQEEFTMIKGGDDIVFPSSTTITLHKPLPDVNWESDITNKVWDEDEPKQIKCYCGHTITCDCEPLQETLEEVAERLFSNFQKENPIIPKKDIRPFKLGFIKGTKWQQERMYSEEEVINIAKQYAKRCQAPIQSTEWLLEQLKTTK